MLRKLLPAFAGIALLLAGAPAARADAPVPKLDWRACDPGFECATAKVPRDYARPHGAKVELALIRRPATDGENRIGSLFVNPGGPGISGVDFVREAPPAALATFGRLYDIVGFDPRGVGASNPPIRGCHARYGDRFVTPDTLDLAALLRNARDQLRSCGAESGGILPHLTTANVARDLDRLRAAVGDEKLNYVGISYGTLIGATYTSLFPGRTAALVLDSPVDADRWLNRPFEALREHIAGFEGSLDRFLHWCGRREQICALDPEDPEDDFDGLVARMNDAPLPVPGEPPVNGDELLAVALESMYGKSSWAPLGAAIARAKQGDGGGVRERGDVSSDGSEPTGALFAYLANEQRYPPSVSRYLRQMEHNHVVADHFWWAPGGYESIGAALWPYDRRGVYRGPFRHPAGAQTPLVIGVTRDPATPYKWAKRYVRDLGNARLLTYRADGHGALTDLNPCIAVAAIRYIEAGSLPPEGASCRQEVPEPGAAALRTGPALEAWR